MDNDEQKQLHKDSSNEPQDKNHDEVNLSDSESDNTVATEDIMKQLKTKISKEPGRKKETKQQIELSEDKTPETEKELANESENTPDQLKSAELQIAALKREIAIRETFDNTMDIFRENKVDVSKDMVKALINDNHDQTLKNVKLLLDFFNKTRHETEISARSKYTGNKLPINEKSTNDSIAFNDINHRKKLIPHY